MDVASVMNDLPFVEHLGIEITAAVDGHAEGRLTLRPEHSSNPHELIAHGGVAYALADTVGGAAAISETLSITPTIDMRIDYLAPATTDLVATGEVVRAGSSKVVADVTVEDVDGTYVAIARGVYKRGGEGERSPWTTGRSTADVEELVGEEQVGADAETETDRDAEALRQVDSDRDRDADRQSDTDQ